MTTNIFQLVCYFLIYRTNGNAIACVSDSDLGPHVGRADANKLDGKQPITV